MNNSRGYSTSREQYPQPWSKWSWDDDNQWWWSRREVAFNKFEYEYQDKDHKPIPVPSSSSRNNAASTLARPSVPTDQYTGRDYTTDRNTVEGLTNALESTILEPTAITISSNHPHPQAHVTTKNSKENSENFDPHYTTHDEWEFKWGRVFKILWSEPTGSAKGGTIISERVGKYGQKFTEKVRRFVIIDNRRGHCICLPIMTYEGQGCLKHGVHQEDHAIIYTSQPVQFRGEERMTKRPIRVRPYTSRHKLEAASRLNYAKVYTIEYNVKVWFIGEIHKDSHWWLTAAYNEVHPPLRSRGTAPLESGASSAFYPPSTGAGPYYQHQYAPSSSASTVSQQALPDQTSFLHPTRSQNQSSMLNSNVQPRAAASDYYPRMDPYDGQSQAGYVSGGQPSSEYQASGSTSRDAAPSDYHDHVPQDTYVPRERRSHHRDFDEDDLYNA